MILIKNTRSELNIGKFHLEKFIQNEYLVNLQGWGSQRFVKGEKDDFTGHNRVSSFELTYSVIRSHSRPPQPELCSLW